MLLNDDGCMVGRGVLIKYKKKKAYPPKFLIRPTNAGWRQAPINCTGRTGCVVQRAAQSASRASCYETPQVRPIWERAHNIRSEERKKKSKQRAETYVNESGHRAGTPPRRPGTATDTLGVSVSVSCMGTVVVRMRGTAEGRFGGGG